MRTLLALLPLIALGCSPATPARFVLERDVGDWSYRRYQRVLDVEIPVRDNQAVGHTATYVQRASRRGSVAFANVFVSVYAAPQGLAAEVRERMRALTSYDAEVREYGGGYVWWLDGGPGDRWALWVSGPHVVKIGAGETLETVPAELVSNYMGVYPSDLDDHGRARTGTQSAGELEAPAEASDEVPSFLRENAPR